MMRSLSLLTLGALALALVVPAAAPPPAGAQPGQSRPKPPAGAARGGKTRAALAKLNLTADQKASLKKLQDETRAKVKAIRAGAGTPEEKKTKARAEQKAMRDKRLAIMTPAQRTQFKQLMSQKEPGKPAAGAKPSPKPAGAKPAPKTGA